MMRKSLVGFAVLFALQWSFAQGSFAQDFQKTYNLAAGGEILIGTFDGDVKVAGYDGNSIEIKAVRKGPDRDPVPISDLSAGNRIHVTTHPSRFHQGEGAVDFEVRVPASVEYNFNRISSFSGNVEVANVVGRLRAESIRGNVEVRNVRGLVSASSVSGNVSVEINRVQGPSNMRFSSISGNIDVLAPADLDAFIDMSSASGILKSDFPVDIQERRYGPGKWARGKLGTGKQVLRISSVSGRVSLTQR